MASRPNGMERSVSQIRKSLDDIIGDIPHYLAVITIDGVPTHFNLFGDVQEASEWATAKDVYDHFRGIATEGDGHYVRMAIGVGIADTTPGMPTHIASLGQLIQAWSIGKRMRDAELPRTNVTPEKTTEAPKSPAKKTTTRKKATSKASSKKSSSKAKTTTKKASSSRRKTPTKAVASKKTTSRKKATTRRSR